MKTLKLRTKLILLALVAAVSLIFQGGFGMMKMGEMAARVQSDLQIVKSETGAMVAIENAQSHFKAQVQEWKNILIRGNDAQSFDKYLGQFDAEEKKVQSNLASAVALMKEVGLSSDDLAKLAQHHLALGESYRSALKEFDKADPNAGKLADTKVKGIDRATSEGMTKMVTTIEQHFSQRIAIQMEQSQATYIASRNGFALIIFLGLLMAVACATIILRDIMRQLGGEPAYAVEVSRRIAQGNLTVPVATRPSDTTSLLASMSYMQSSLIDLVRQVHQISGSLSASTQQVHAATKHVSAGSEQQNEAASAMAAAVEEMTVSIGHVATNAQDARNMALEVGTASEEGGRVVKEVITDINAIAEAFKHSALLVGELGKQSTRISDIALVIKEIADQTNLLALNAAIEAARAGEHGRGFAVVADEVRKLAERTTKSTSEIASMIVTIQNGTQRAVDGMSASTAQIIEGVEMASRAGGSMAQIEISAQSVLNASTEISEALNEQSAASTLIAKNVESISNMAEENSSSVKEVVLATEHLEALAREMIVSVDRFKLTSAA